MKSASAVRATLISVAIGLAVAGCDSSDNEMSQKDIQYLSHLDQSRFLQRQGELKASTVEARSAIDLQPENPEPKAGDARNAERQLDWLIDAIPEASMDATVRHQAALIRAEARLMQGLTTDALATLDRIETEDRNLLIRRSLLKARALLAAGRAADAERVYEEARSLDANSALPLVGLSRVAHASGDPEQAKKMIEEAQTVDPQNAELWLWKAQLAHEADNWPVAEEAYIRALEDIGQYDIMTY
ncbi:unnamed protein product, partial [Ectocarpus sp. 12 AP-2014]